jgi:hypothetical protein
MWRLLMGTRFIFIVGVSRSGTSLIRQILNYSSQIAICEENHFLGHLLPSEGARYKFRKFGDLSDDYNVRRLVEYIYSGEFKKDTEKHRFLSFHWRWVIKWVDKNDFLQKILNSDRSERALFVVMMQVFANHMGKPIMGEKTPIHFRYVPTLLEWFSDGKVIHMIRDPRAIFTSEFRVRQKEAITSPFKQLKRIDFLFKLYIVLQTTMVWFESTQRYQKYKKAYPTNYYPLRFEDLIDDPEKHIKQICNFLGVEYQDEMLEQKVISRGFQLGHTGFDTQAASRWNELIDPWINRWFRFWFRKPLKEFGYI